MLAHANLTVLATIMNAAEPHGNETSGRVGIRRGIDSVRGLRFLLHRVALCANGLCAGRWLGLGIDEERRCGCAGPVVVAGPTQPAHDRRVVVRRVWVSASPACGSP